MISLFKSLLFSDIKSVKNIMNKTQVACEFEGPGSSYANKTSILWVTGYLIFMTFISMAVLAVLWPTYEDSTWTLPVSSELSISSISPSHGKIKEEVWVSIRGTGFTDTTKVNFGTADVPQKDIIIADSTHLRVKGPNQTPEKEGVVDIVVSNPEQNKRRALVAGFYYYKDKPSKATISFLSPNTGPLTGGQTVTIKGSGFDNKITEVRFGGVLGTNLYVQNNESLVVTTPTHGVGKVDVAVDAGEITTSSESYTYAYWVSPFSLLIMVICAGGLGGCLHGFRSLLWNVGYRKLRASWLLKYCLLPIVGAAIAVIFFLAVSAGFTTIQGSSIFVLIGLSGLVGMFGNEAAEKLKKIAEGLLSEVRKDEVAESGVLSITLVKQKTGSEDVEITGQNFDDVEVHFGAEPAAIKSWSLTRLIVVPPVHHQSETVDVTVIRKNGQSFTQRKAYIYQVEPTS